MKERIKFLLEDALPLVDFDTDFLFSELDSLGIASILMILSEEYKINLDGKDVTPRNFKSLDSLVSMVQNKLDNNK